MKTRETAGIVFFTSALLMWLVGLIFFTQSITQNIPEPPKEKLEAIVVLTGGSNRINAGFDLLEKGLGNKLFISGVYRGVDAKELLSLWKDKPQKNLDCCVVLGFEAYNTIENAMETIEWLKKENLRSLYLVTSNYHMKRALLEFQNRAPTLQIIPHPIIPSKVEIGQWWTDTKTRNLFVREYNKYIAAYLFNLFLEH